MAHRNDQLTDQQTYELRFTAFLEIISGFFQKLRQKLDRFPYASGKPIKPYHENFRGKTNQNLSQAVMTSQMYIR